MLMKPPLMTRIKQAWKAIFSHYEAARNQPWQSWLQGPLQQARLDLRAPTRMELQRKSRYWERNNALVQRLADLFEQYTIGTGLSFYPASDDDEWNQAARRYWLEWEPAGDF